MQPLKSDSFTFHRNSSVNSSNSSTRSDGLQQCRRKLKYKFEEDESNKEDKAGQLERSAFSVLSLNDTRKALRHSAERISKTFNTVRTSLETFTQRFKTTTRRRQILEEGPMTPNCQQTPHTFSKQVLGRTPTKLYSPFGIDSPYNRPTTIDKENVPAYMARPAPDSKLISSSVRV